MTRDEQAKALYDWWCITGKGGWHASTIVDHFPAFMAKCAEIGLCHHTWDGPTIDQYNVRKPEPPHEHEWRLFVTYGTPPGGYWQCLCGEVRLVAEPLT